VDADAYLADHAAKVDDYLDERLPKADEPPEVLHTAMRHLVFPGGKRLRPALAFAGCEAIGKLGPTAALPAAAAVELIHAYSLVHDDLPCMDDDALRRGRPTVHVAFGEAMAVLAGDALQTEAFAVLAAPGPLPAPEGVVLAASRDLAAAAGSHGLVGGQADDLACGAGTEDAALVESIHRRKTAALIAAAVVLGARFGGADAEAAARLGRFGRRIGLAFQIADDLLDRDSDGASSYVRVRGEEGSRARAEELLGEALAEIDAWGERAEPLRELARFAVRRKR
jgi:geranylgeranyl pyrophosphate synthase